MPSGIETCFGDTAAELLDAVKIYHAEVNISRGQRLKLSDIGLTDGSFPVTPKMAKGGLDGPKNHSQEASMNLIGRDPLPRKDGTSSADSPSQLLMTTSVTSSGLSRRIHAIAPAGG